MKIQLEKLLKSKEINQIAYPPKPLLRPDLVTKKRLNLGDILDRRIGHMPSGKFGKPVKIDTQLARKAPIIPVLCHLLLEAFDMFNNFHTHQFSNLLLTKQAKNCLIKNKPLLVAGLIIVHMTNTKKIVAGNVKTLLDHRARESGRKMSQAEFGKLAGLSQRTVSYLFDDENVESIRSDTIDKLAEYFGLQAFHLMIPKQPIEELLSNRIEKLVENYLHSDNSGKHATMVVSETRAHYQSEEYVRKSANGNT
jgi:transcriptional regulator with XRE-family HTH domain